MTSPPPPELVPAQVQKATVRGDVCVLEVFAGRKRFLVFEPGRCALVDDKPPRDAGEPPALQGQVRKELVPSILTAVDDDHRRFVFARTDAPLRIVLIEADANDPRWLLLAPTPAGERILATSPATRATDGRDLRRGRWYERPRTPPQTMTPSTTTSSFMPTKKPAADPVRHDLKVRLKAEVDRKRRLLKALQGDQTRHGDPTSLEEEGELLKTVMGRVKRGVASIDVVSFDGVPRTLMLDPALDAKHNLMRLFGKAKKARSALARTAPRLKEAHVDLQALEQLRSELLGIDLLIPPHIDLVTRIETQLSSGGPTARRKAAMQTARSTGRLAWRSFVVATAVVVRVGRGARDNDALVKSAKGNDLWLHARDATGAHVVIQSAGGPVPDDVLRDASLLAAWFSSLRGERHVDIQHTRVKNLRKPGGGAPAGLFLVSNESVLGLRVDDERVSALLAAEVAAGAIERPPKSTLPR